LVRDVVEEVARSEFEAAEVVFHFVVADRTGDAVSSRVRALVAGLVAGLALAVEVHVVAWRRAVPAGLVGRAQELVCLAGQALERCGDAGLAVRVAGVAAGVLSDEEAVRAIDAGVVGA